MKVALIAGLVTVLLVPSIARCAPMGSPASNVGKENYVITVEYEEQKKKVGNDESSSWRWLTRIAWGPHEKVDLYARIGAANLKVDTESGHDREHPPLLRSGALPQFLQQSELLRGSELLRQVENPRRGHPERADQASE